MSTTFFHIAHDAPSGINPKGYSDRVRGDTTAPPAGGLIVAISLLNKHMQNFVCSLLGKWMVLK